MPERRIRAPARSQKIRHSGVHPLLYVCDRFLGRSLARQQIHADPRAGSAGGLGVLVQPREQTQL